MTSTSPKGTLGSVAYWLAVALYQWNPDRNHKLWNTVSSDIYFICRCCSRKGRTIRPRRSYLYFTAFNVPWTILSWMWTSWQILAQTTFTSKTVGLVHTSISHPFQNTIEMLCKHGAFFAGSCSTESKNDILDKNIFGNSDIKFNRNPLLSKYI